MKRSIFLLAALISFSLIFSQSENNTEKIPVLIRCDDLGMCHSVNVAAKQVLETGLPVSMSVMVPCPWFSEAVELLKQYRNVSVGIHLTLNSEWKQYRWGPVTGVNTVPSLVDSVGYFFLPAVCCIVIILRLQRLRQSCGHKLIKRLLSD